MCVYLLLWCVLNGRLYCTHRAYFVSSIIMWIFVKVLEPLIPKSGIILSLSLSFLFFCPRHMSVWLPSFRCYHLYCNIQYYVIICCNLSFDVILSVNRTKITFTQNEQNNLYEWLQTSNMHIASITMLFSFFDFLFADKIEKQANHICKLP